MKILIDTQVLVWLLNDSAELGPKTLRQLTDTSNQVCVSYFSFFEIAIKASVGKMTFDSSVIDDLPKMGIDLIMPSVEHLNQYRIHNQSDSDPFNNALITVALIEKCAFATSDTKILSARIDGLQRITAVK